MGTRKAEEIDFESTCIISGLNRLEPIHALLQTKEILIRQDFANFVIEFLNCKFDVLCPKDIALKWANNDNYKLTVFSQSITTDYESTARILLGFVKKFTESDATKINY
jgi:hypothetical protein